MTQDVEGRDGLGCQPDKHVPNDDPTWKAADALMTAEAIAAEP